MLSPIPTEAVRREFATYDLEWHPETLAVACVGMYDGVAYVGYRTVDEFLHRALREEYHGRILYAHAGGSYDVQFVLERLVEWGPGAGFRISCGFSGSAAVIVKVEKGKHKWFFCDSFFLLRGSLAEIAKSIGEEKGDRDGAMDLIRAGRHHTRAGWRELLDYNESDCKILYKGVHKFQEWLLTMGGEMRATLASCAMTLFRRQYLHTHIKTSTRANKFCEPAYVASRVEVHERHAQDALYYDFNSSFPYSMKHARQPGNMIGWTRGIPKGEGALYLAECDVEVPPCRVPPLPWRGKEGRIFFPTGKWTSLFDSTDVELLEEFGGKIHKVRRVMAFEPFDDLGRYVDALHAMKQDADDRLARGDKSAKFDRMMAKLFLNSLYGKFAEKSLKTKILIHPKSTRCPHRPRHPGDECMRLILPGVWECEEETNVPHAHFPISIHVTAYSRALLYRQLVNRDTLFYCDTDSIVTRDVLPVGTALGTLKLEHPIECGDFLAPKLYAMKVPGEDGEEAKYKVKSKGFSRLSYEQFCDLIDGREVYFDRMARMKERLREGTLAPARMDLSKKLHLMEWSPEKALKGSFPKRAPEATGGGTRPWDVEELVAKKMREEAA